MNIKLILFKDSNCDNCKLIQNELLNNPPNCDVTICHVKHECSKCVISKYNLISFPTTILFDENNKEIHRFIGYVDSKTINKQIDKYVTECMV